MSAMEKRLRGSSIEEGFLVAGWQLDNDERQHQRGRIAGRGPGKIRLRLETIDGVTLL